MKILRVKNKNDEKRIGIVSAKDWFPKTKPYYITDKDYVVGEWYDFHDGSKSNIEGRMTIAICREFKDAKMIFDKK